MTFFSQGKNSELLSYLSAIVFSRSINAPPHINRISLVSTWNEEIKVI
jgi:hypothetical protein